MPDPAPPASAPGSSIPYITGGGGFALGLFSTFGVKDLLASTQHALALTVFGLVTCLILVIAIATMDMKTIPKKDGSSFAVGDWAAGVMAVVMLLFGIAGAFMFLGDFWLHSKIPAKAYYSLNAIAPDNMRNQPTMLVNGQPTDLRLSNEGIEPLEIARDAVIEVRVAADPNGNPILSKKMSDGALPAY